MREMTHTVGERGRCFYQRGPLEFYTRGCMILIKRVPLNSGEVEYISSVNEVALQAQDTSFEGVCL